MVACHNHRGCFIRSIMVYRLPDGAYHILGWKNWSQTTGPALPQDRLGSDYLFTLVWVVGVQTLAVNRIPHQMSLYMLFLIILAADVSLIFEKRTFCSYICPVGHMLGLYALISPFEWRADNLSTCRNCATKDCVTKKNNYRAIGRSCTSNLYPASISDNRDCLLCTQCLKACPNKNLRFSIRKPFADFFKNIDLTPAQIGFIILIGGFVVYEVLSEWPVSYMILMWIPDYCINALGITGMPANFLSAIIMFVLLPALLFLIVAALAKLASRNTEARFGATAGTFALLLLPTAASAHIIKSIIKMSNQIPFWHGAISDPRGLETAQKIISGAIEPDYSITDALDPAVSVVIAAILLVSLAATMLIFCRSEIVQKHPSGVKKVLLISVLAYWSIFALMIFNWRFG